MNIFHLQLFIKCTTTSFYWILLLLTVTLTLKLVNFSGFALLHSSAGNNFSLFTGHMSFQIFILVGHLTNWTGHYLLTDITLKKITQDVLVRCSVIVSDHNVKLAGHFQNLVGQCPMTDCYFQHCTQWLVESSRATFSTNQKWNQNQSWLTRPHFPALLCRLRVITSSFYSFTWLFPSFLIGQSHYFGFDFTEQDWKSL